MGYGFIMLGVNVMWAIAYFLAAEILRSEGDDDELDSEPAEALACVGVMEGVSEDMQWYAIQDSAAAILYIQYARYWIWGIDEDFEEQGLDDEFLQEAST